MSGIESSGEFDDTNSDLYEQEVINVTSTPIEAVCTGTDLFEREFVRIYNKGNSIVYFGPSGVNATTGEPLRRRQSVEIAIRGQSVFLVTSGGTADVIVTDLG